MDTQVQTIDRTSTTTRLVSAAPLSRPEDFARAIASITGTTPVIADMQGFVGRNDNWRVPTRGAGELFVKRLVGDTRHVEARINRVLAVEGIVAAHPPREFRMVPFHGADRDQALLIFDCLPQSRTASELLAEDEFEPGLAERLGRVLGEIHRLPRTSINVDESLDAKAAIAFYALSPERYASCSGGEVEAWAMLQHDKVLTEALGRLRRMSGDAPTTATHCDVRLDQFLLVGDEVYVIDWEEFRYDDPARDVGGFVGEFIHRAATRMFAELEVEAGLAPGAAHEAILANGERQLAMVQDHIRRFWDGYRAVADVDDGLAVRATGYAGWHFFDRLLAGAMHGAKLSAAERGMAGIGRNALTQPERFAPTIGLDRD